MSDPLHGAAVKVARANQHIGELHRWLVEAIDGDKDFPVWIERDPDGLHEIQILRHIHRGTVPDNALAIVGDAVHNLRSALDHVAWAIAFKHNERIAQEEFSQISFRIKKTLCPGERKSVDDAKSMGKIEGRFGADGLRFFGRYHPHPGRHGENLLEVISRLDNADKHRALLTTGINVAVGLNPSAKWKSLKEDVVIARWPISESKPDASHIITVAFDEPYISKEQPVQSILLNASTLVGIIVEDARQIFFSGA